MSLAESTYNGFSFYKSNHDENESVDWSMISTEYKISDKMNDLNTSKNTKETQFMGIKHKEEDASTLNDRKWSDSRYSNNAFEFNDTQRIFSQFSDQRNNPELQWETNDKVCDSPEPEIHKPHVGNNKKTIRERNLEEYFRESRNESELHVSPNPNEISNFLDSFDTGEYSIDYL